MSVVIALFLMTGSMKCSVSSLLHTLTTKTKHTMVIDRVRAGASELANMAGILGGITSQEVIKLVTNQYVPMNNTLLFNGIKASVGVYEL